METSSTDWVFGCTNSEKYRSIHQNCYVEKWFGFSYEFANKGRCEKSTSDNLMLAILLTCEMLMLHSCKKFLKLRDGPNGKAWCLSLFWISIVLCSFLQCLLGIVFGPQTKTYYDKADEEEVCGVRVAKFLAAIWMHAHLQQFKAERSTLGLIIGRAIEHKVSIHGGGWENGMESFWFLVILEGTWW